MSLVKDDQQRLSAVIENDLAVDTEYIAHHTLDAEGVILGHCGANQRRVQTKALSSGQVLILRKSYLICDAGNRLYGNACFFGDIV